MTPFQKVIKYGAIAFGIYLCFIILSAILSVITAIFGISTGMELYKTYTSEETKILSSIEEVYEDVKKIDINLDVSRLTIKEGEAFKLEVINPTDKFSNKIEDDILKIEDERSKWFNTNEKIPEIIIYIPQNTILEKVDIKAGVNEINIEKLNASNIEIENGVGKFLYNK